MTSTRQIAHRILFAPRHGGLDRAVNMAIVGLIFANVVAIVLESVDSIRASAGSFFRAFDAVSVVFFSVEYIARAWAWRPKDGNRSRFAYLIGPLPMIDLMAILPWYLPLIGLDLRVLRVLRIARIFRIAKLGRYSSAIGLISGVLKNARYELGVTLSIGTIMLLIASTGIYHAEHEAQPEVFSSIPASAWWTVTTLTTVGYGDTYPITIAGKIFGAIVATLGIGLFGLPTAILAGAFMDAFRQKREASEDGFGDE